MTSLPCSILPRTLNFVLLVMAWLAVPAWVFALAGMAFFLDDDDSMFAALAAVVCSFALFAAFFAGRVDKFAIEPAEKREEAYQVALHRLGRSTTRPQPALRRVSS